jgi:hypothetical protein
MRGGSAEKRGEHRRSPVQSEMATSNRELRALARVRHSTLPLRYQGRCVLRRGESFKGSLVLPPGWRGEEGGSKSETRRRAPTPRSPRDRKGSYWGRKAKRSIGGEPSSHKEASSGKEPPAPRGIRYFRPEPERRYSEERRGGVATDRGDDRPGRASSPRGERCKDHLRDRGPSHSLTEAVQTPREHKDRDGGR